MYHFSEINHTYAKRLVLRKIRAVAILMILPLAIWQTPHHALPYIYILSGLSVALTLFDLGRNRQSLYHSVITPYDWFAMISNTSLISGFVYLSGGIQSPLFGLLMIPLVIYALEFDLPGIIVGSFPFLLIMVIGLINQSWGAVKPHHLVILFLVGIAIAIIWSTKQISSHYHQKIARLLTRDDLTALYNRRFLKANMLQRIKEKRAFGLIMLDINYFKCYNDHWGHPKGDILLIQFGRTLRATARKEDLVFRYSGDEFIILMPHASQNDLDQLINQIHQALANEPFPGEDCFPNRKLSITCGSELYCGGKATYDSLLSSIDQTLYKFKGIRAKH